jgi:glycosyltransferase involved in cell wall biosynthesis
MNVMAIGKFPPMQGGVATQMFGLTRALGARGHRVTAVTDAEAVGEEARVAMLPGDRREGGLPGVRMVSIARAGVPAPRGDGRTIVAALLNAAQRAADRSQPPDIVFSFYLEPYAIAGDILANRFGVPHVVRTAGSDAHRFRTRPRVADAYAPILRRAAAVWTSSVFGSALAAHGVDAARMTFAAGSGVDFHRFRTPPDPGEIGRLRRHVLTGSVPGMWGDLRPGLKYVGMYGKFEREKRHEDLLDALVALRERGQSIGAILMCGGNAEQVERVRRAIAVRALEDRVVRLPFLAPWYVPAFMKLVDAVCCIEQDFPISGHNPVTAREALVAGKCLIASHEVLRKLPSPERLVSGFNCLALRDVGDTRELARTIEWAVVRNDGRSTIEGRARRYADDFLRGPEDADILDRILDVARRDFDSAGVFSDDAPDLDRTAGAPALSVAPPARARSAAQWNAEKRSAAAWRRECALVQREIRKLGTARGSAGQREGHEGHGGPFRLARDLAGMSDRQLCRDRTMKVVGLARLKLLDLKFDASELLEAIRRGEVRRSQPYARTRRRRLLVVRGRGGEKSRFFLIDARHAPGVCALVARRNRGSVGRTGLRLFEAGILGLSIAAHAEKKGGVE